jgi:hypothetical protein
MASGMCLMIDGAHLCKACHQHRQEELESALKEMNKKCIVKDCVNHNGEGSFVDNLCVPCHAFVVKGFLNHSQACRNAVKAGNEFLQAFVKSIDAGKFHFVDNHIEID